LENIIHSSISPDDLHEILGLIKPFTKNDHQARFNTALSILAAECKNEIWMVASQNLKKIEDIYGHIKNLNFSGKNEIKFSAKNVIMEDFPLLGIYKFDLSGMRFQTSFGGGNLNVNDFHHQIRFGI
jgi:hypothetical protein